MTDLILSLTNKLTQFIEGRIEDTQIKTMLLANLQHDIQCENTESLIKISEIFDVLDEYHLLPIEIKEFFKGGHFMLEDSGRLYKNLEAHGYQRISSHYNDQVKTDSDIGIKAGKTIAQLLVGKTDTHTWLQIENSAMPSVNNIFNDYEAFTDFVGHATDFIIYAASLKTVNVGQYGLSKFPDSNPIKLDNKYVSDTECLENYSEYVVNDVEMFMSGEGDNNY